MFRSFRSSVFLVPALLAAAGSTAPATARAADPWADAFLNFTPGIGGSPVYADPAAAVGEPTRFSGVVFGFPAAVTPFSPPFDPGEIVSIGSGGSLTIRFDEPVTDDPLNPYGVDLLLFGNAFYTDLAFPTGTAGPLGAETGVVEVSADGMDWRTIPLVNPDGAFPTLGYSDLTDPYSTTPGLVNSDFTRPVDPSFDPTGLTFVDIVAGYSGSGGGAGVDLAAASLSSISFVRVSKPAGPPGKFEIDAFADVSPVPATPAPVLLLIAAAVRSRRRVFF